MGKTYSAAMIVIGNEILSGRTRDKNINYVACKLVECGVDLVEVRIVPDIEDIIISTVRELKVKVDYVFTSGGIGPTHDDITAQSISKACSVDISENAEARSLLLEHYGDADLNDARLRMAQIPEGGILIPNPVSAAPGFQIDNIYVMAGVPQIMQAMMDHVASNLQGGAVVQIRTIPSTFPESKIAKDLGEIQKKYMDVDIGSYPYFKDSFHGVNVVIRSSDEQLLDAVEQAVIGMLESV